ncbi:hypothetical protein LUW76_02905 [Actinomadura madurae]|nr:hypothetical protein [Actinomadura madurae]URM93363.1 hypothetical protein LUW76_02905 [Actinomadura madurae]
MRGVGEVGGDLEAAAGCGGGVQGAAEQADAFGEAGEPAAPGRQPRSPAGRGSLATVTVMVAGSPSRWARVTVTAAPGACLAALVMASWTTRCAVSAVSGAGAGGASAGSPAGPAVVRETGTPEARARATSSGMLSRAGGTGAPPAGPAAGRVPPPGSAGFSPGASSRRTPMISRRCSVASAAPVRSSAAAARCRSPRSAATSRAPARTAMSASSWPRESCMSWAMRARSRSRSRSAMMRCWFSRCSARSQPARRSSWYWRQ